MHAFTWYNVVLFDTEIRYIHSCAQFQFLYQITWKKTSRIKKRYKNMEDPFLDKISEIQSHRCIMMGIIRQRERVKLRSWLTDSRLTWHRPETRFERSNRILAPQLRGYVRRKVRQPGGENRIANCARGGDEKSREKCAQPNEIPENTRLLIKDAIYMCVYYLRCFIFKKIDQINLRCIITKDTRLS